MGISQEVIPCYTDEMTEKFIQSLTPEEREQYRQDQISYSQELQNYITAHPEIQTNSGSRAVQYTIPVVFHIIHAGGPENISNEQVENCIQVMNEDYQKLNSDAGDVQNEFIPLVADAEIQFKLARKKPNGDCTNGITRTFSAFTYSGSEGERIGVVQDEHGYWPGDEYLNVFVVSGFDGSVAGYTYRPSDWIGAGMNNGIHILHNYVGSIGTGSSYTGRTMSHEVGHWLDLPHTWGTTNNNNIQSNCGNDFEQDDNIDDTPMTIGSATGVCDLNRNTCDLDNDYWGYDIIDNVENYMEYSYCSKMFTLGQKARMHAALNSTTGGRNNVHTSANLANTGVNNPEIMCQANFQSDNQIVCPGQAISFTDYSYHDPIGWEWEFPGGTPSTSTDQNPTVTYNNPGVYEVILTANDGTNYVSETKNSYITVLENSSNLPFSEGFEDYTSLSNSPWIIENPNGLGFELDSNVSHNGNKSIRLNNFGQQSGLLDNIYSQPIDLSSITDDVTLSFKYAYRKRSSSNDEWLRVYITRDCGETWVQRKTLKGNTLSELTESSSWEPESKEDWTTVHVTNITGYYWVDNFRMRFEFESDGGNNFFMDDINLYQGTSNNDPVSVSNETVSLSEFNVYPNPASDEANVVFNIDNSKKATVEIISAIGQTVQVSNINAKSGKNLVMLNTSDVEAGIYMIRVTVDGIQNIKRLIIK